MKATYQEALEHMKKDKDKNNSIYEGLKYQYNPVGTGWLSVKVSNGTWELSKPTKNMKDGIWYIPYDQLEPEKDCSNCDKLEYEFTYLGIKAEKRHCEINKKAMEYIGLEGEKTKFCCSLHGYKEE